MNLANRTEALASYAILDTQREPAFDEVARIAALVCRTPVAVVNLVADDRQWFKAEVGLGVQTTPLETSFCAQALLQRGLTVVRDATQGPRFACNPLVTGAPHLRFYAGAVLETSEGVPIGTVCVLDYQPRAEGLGEMEREVLTSLARVVMALLEQRKFRRSEARTWDAGAARAD